jgi:hypothetical protein
MVLTGEHPMVGWARPRWFPVLPLLIAAPAVILMPVAFSAIPEMLGGYIHLLADRPATTVMTGPWEAVEFRINVWASVVLVGCLALALFSSYRWLERISAIVLGAIVTCVAASVVVFGPDMVGMVEGMLVPGIPPIPEWIHANPSYADEFRNRSPWLEISLYLSAVGGGAFDYIGYVGMLREKRWGLAGGRVVSRAELQTAVSDPTTLSVVRERAQLWCRAPLIDTLVSFFLVVLVTVLFAVLATLVLHPQQAIPAQDNFLSGQEQFLTRLHPSLKWVYRIGVFLAFVGTIYGAFEVYRHTVVESVRSMAPALVPPARVRLVRGITLVYCMTGGLSLIWLSEHLAGSIVERMTFGTVISGANACGLWCFAMLWVDRIRFPPPLRMSRLLQLCTFVAGASMLGLGIQALLAYFAG